MPQSMTGFGAAEGPAGPGRLRVEIRTVNHRYFNFAPKLPGDLVPLEGEFRERLRREFDRGHVALSVRWLEAAEREVTLMVDVDRARIIADRLRELQTAAGLGGTVDLDLVARQPDVLRLDRNEDASRMSCMSSKGASEMSAMLSSSPGPLLSMATPVLTSSTWPSSSAVMAATRL